MRLIGSLRQDHKAAASGASFIVAVVAIVIGLALLPVVLDFINDSSMRANLSATQLTILDLVPTFYLIGMFVGVIAWLAVTGKRG